MKQASGKKRSIFRNVQVNARNLTDANCDYFKLIEFDFKD